MGLCGVELLLFNIGDTPTIQMKMNVHRAVLTSVRGRGKDGRRLRAHYRRRESPRLSCCGPTSQRNCSRPKKRSLT